MRNILVFVLAIIIGLTLFAEEKKPKVAVMEIEDTTGAIPATVLSNATEILRGLLTSSGAFVVIDKSRQREKIQEIVKNEKKESWKECYDQSCRIQLGQSLAADSILRTTISCLGKECYFSSEIVDLAKEANVGGGTAGFVYNEKDMKSLKGALESVVTQVVELAKNLAIEKEERLKRTAEAEQKRQENEAKLQEMEKQKKIEQEKALEAELSTPPKQEPQASESVAVESKLAPMKSVEEKKVETVRPYLWFGVGAFMFSAGALATGFVCNEEVRVFNDKAKRIYPNDNKKAGDYLDIAKSYEIARPIMWGLSGAFAVTGLVLVLITKEKQPENMPVAFFDGKTAYLGYSFKY